MTGKFPTFFEVCNVGVLLFGGDKRCFNIRDVLLLSFLFGLKLRDPKCRFVSFCNVEEIVGRSSMSKPRLSLKPTLR